MKNYDLIAIGTGSSMNIVGGIQQQAPNMKIAVIDKDEPGGICLTKGCIPTKILVYPAELVRDIQAAKKFGIDVEFKGVNFKQVMERMRSLIYKDINMIHDGLSNAPGIDYYQEPAQFIAPYTFQVGKEQIKGNTILLCTGSKPKIPEIKGLDTINYHTSDSILKLTELPETLVIVGGGYIAAEYGHFFSAMGSKVVVLGRNPMLLPQEEPEISWLAKQEMSKHMRIFTNHKVAAVEAVEGGKKKVIAVNRETGKAIGVTANEVLIAAGRSSNSDILNPEAGGIATDERGWLKVNEQLETNLKNVWAFGDATGKHLFKHVANYESEVVFYNAFTDIKQTVDYHAIPHAVFSHPEIAGVGMREQEAVAQYGKDKVQIGFQKYENTAKGMAMDIENYFVKVILEDETQRILGAHIIGPQASVLLQEIINLMYTKDGSADPIQQGMHIHPALNEVVERAFGGPMSVDHYQHMIKHEPWHPEFGTHSHGGHGHGGHGHGHDGHS